MVPPDQQTALVGAEHVTGEHNDEEASMLRCSGTSRVRVSVMVEARIQRGMGKRMLLVEIKYYVGWVVLYGRT